MIEHSFTCPYCWSSISMLIDPSISQQSYIEDCENCCNPIQIDITVNQNEILNFSAQKIGQ